jgi:hypothetical protein
MLAQFSDCNPVVPVTIGDNGRLATTSQPLVFKAQPWKLHQIERGYQDHGPATLSRRLREFREN